MESAPNARSYPFPRTCPFDPAPMLGELRDSEPVTRIRMEDGRVAWLVTRHSDACAVLSDSRFSANATHPDYPVLHINAARRASISRMDDPRHGELRRMLQPEFLPARMAGYRAEAQRIAEERIDRILSQPPPVDLVPAFVHPIPFHLLSKLLGLRPADQERVRYLSIFLDKRSRPTGEQMDAEDELFAISEKRVSEEEAEPGDNALGRIVVDHLRAGRIEHAELVNLTRLLATAGWHISANSIALSILSLLHDPVQFQQLREHPERLPSAADELTRYHTVVQDGTTRFAIEDVTVADTLIRAGEGVVVNVAAANRDEERFPDPDRIDPGRNARRHLTFGHGVHKCVGLPLAQVALEVALETLLRRVPTVRLAVPFEELRFGSDMHIYGVHELPVTW